MSTEKLLNEISIAKMVTGFSETKNSDIEIYDNLTREYGLLSLGNIERLTLNSFAKNHATSGLVKALNLNKSLVSVESFLALTVDKKGYFRPIEKVGSIIESHATFAHPRKRKALNDIFTAYKSASTVLGNQKFYNWLESSLMPTMTRMRMLQEKYAVKQR